MSERGLGRELEDLRRRIGPALCAHPAPCRITVNTELVLHPDGIEEAVGEEPPPLCASCPERQSGRLRVRWVQVVRDLRNRDGRGAAPSRARIAHNGHDDGPEEHGNPLTTAAPTAPEPERGDGIPAAWGPDHPARPAPEGRGPPPPYRCGDDGTVRVQEQEASVEQDEDRGQGGLPNWQVIKARRVVELLGADLVQEALERHRDLAVYEYGSAEKLVRSLVEGQTFIQTLICEDAGGERQRLAMVTDYAHGDGYGDDILCTVVATLEEIRTNRDAPSEWRKRVLDAVARDTEHALEPAPEDWFGGVAQDRGREG